MGVTVEFRCADGSPFPVTFADETQAGWRWIRETEHAPRCLPTLHHELERLGRPGGRRAYTEVGMEMPSSWRSGPAANGWAYFAPTGFDPDELEAIFEGCGRLVEEYGSAFGIWREHSLPRLERACAEIVADGHTWTVAQLAEASGYAFQLTMIPALVGGNDINLMAAACAEVTGDDGRLAALELSQGYGNATLDADQRLWELANLPDDQRAGAEAAFLDEYGWRCEQWTVTAPMWRERGPGYAAVLARAAGAPPPAAVTAQAAARRAELLARLLDGLDGDPEKQARLRRRADRLATYTAMREERAHWQLSICGFGRHALLRKADAMVATGRIDDRDDIFHLTAEEIDGDAPLHPVVAVRRAEFARWSAVVPPAAVGAPGPESAAGARLLRGVGASRGSVTGRARVIATLDEADRLEPGDVLVCVATAPPWTPLFTIAAAVVVDGGDMSSHSAVAAREYGIPAVVGLNEGTAVIPDGVTVTVDGAAGTVSW